MGARTKAGSDRWRNCSSRAPVRLLSSVKAARRALPRLAARDPESSAQLRAATGGGAGRGRARRGGRSPVAWEALIHMGGGQRRDAHYASVVAATQRDPCGDAVDGGWGQPGACPGVLRPPTGHPPSALLCSRSISIHQPYGPSTDHPLLLLVPGMLISAQSGSMTKFIPNNTIKIFV